MAEAETVTVTGAERLSPEDLEQLHIRLATAASLNDTNIPVESIISDILSGRDEPVPQYEPTATNTNDILRIQIENNDTQVWDAVFTAIEKGQIDVLDHFVSLKFDVTQQHPKLLQYPIYIAARASQTKCHETSYQSWRGRQCMVLSPSSRIRVFLDEIGDSGSNSFANTIDGRGGTG